MKPLLFATGNDEKFESAQHLCKTAGITLLQFGEDSDEIQSEDPKQIIRDKVARKFALAGNQPVIVSDDTWDIPALKGFPGPYMKDMNHWFAPQQFVDLMLHVADRRIFLHQYLAYQDSATFKIFLHTFPAHVIAEPRGEYGQPAQKVVALDADNGLSISEVYDKDPVAAARRFTEETSAWHEFIAWYKDYVQ